MSGAGVINVEGVQVRTGQLINIKASQIVKNATTLTLREVDTKSKEYEQIKRSIGEPRVRETTLPDGTVKREVVCPHGLLNPISVRPLPGEPGKYALVDGGHRHAAWTELFGDALPIPAQVIDLNEIQTMEAQIEGNFHVKKTRPAEYVKQIKRLMETYPLRTIEEQAERLHMDPATLRQWFGLLNLAGTRWREEKDDQGEVISRKSEIAIATDEGRLPLSAAFVISTASSKREDEKDFWNKKQDELFDAALAASDSRQPQAIARFCMEATATIREIKKKLKEGKSAENVQVETQPVSRRLGEMKIELQRQTEVILANKADKQLQASIAELAQAYPDALRAVRQDGYFDGIRYALQVDDETVAQRKKEKEEQLAAKKEKQDEKKAGSKAAALSRSAGMFGRRLTPG